MNKKLIVTLLLGGISTLTYSADTNVEVKPNTTTTEQTTPPPAATNPTQQSANDANKENPNPETISASNASAGINCEYKIAPEQTNIEPQIIKTWAEYATKKSFDMKAGQLDEQMDDLKNCFTQQGWEGFQTALDKSGNIKAIKAKKLDVSSQIDGPVELSQVKANQWKATMPVTVLYQNDTQKLSQVLSVDLMIGRKISGDLGVMQMIATPRVAQNQKNPANTSDNQTASKKSDDKPSQTSTSDQTN